MNAKWSVYKTATVKLQFIGKRPAKKQRLPIRYARRNLGTLNTLSVNVGKMTRGIEDDVKKPDEQRKQRIRTEVLSASLSSIALAVVIIIVCVILLC